MEARIQRLALLEKAEAETTLAEQELQTGRSLDPSPGLTFVYNPSKQHKEIERLKRENRRLRKAAEKPGQTERLEKIISQKDRRILDLQKQLAKQARQQEEKKTAKELAEVAKLEAQKDRLAKELAFIELKKAQEERNPSKYQTEIQELKAQVVFWQGKAQTAQAAAQEAVKTAKHEVRLLRIEALKLKQQFKRECKALRAKLPESVRKPRKTLPRSSTHSVLKRGK